MKYKDLTGLRIGKLTVLEPTDQRVRSAVVWKCRCDCGREIFVLRQGNFCGEPPAEAGGDLQLRL